LAKTKGKCRGGGKCVHRIACVSHHKPSADRYEQMLDLTVRPFQAKVLLCRLFIVIRSPLARHAKQLANSATQVTLLAWYRLAIWLGRTEAVSGRDTT